ncbi:MAG TPA: hypothetical protein VNA25_29625 [Phycisphaerae bacterium]|nr:hypothetical protein [Phycisphaerae bacterium]
MLGITELQWTITLGVLGLIIVPYNIWLVREIFDARARLKVVEQQQMDMTKRSDDRDQSITCIFEKLDEISNDTAYLRGRMKGN